MRNSTVIKYTTTHSPLPQLYMVSAPAVGVCVVGALWVMVAAFWAEEQLIDWKRRYGSVAGVFTHVPSAFYACLVWLMNYYYRRLATALTDWGECGGVCGEGGCVCV